MFLKHKAAFAGNEFLDRYRERRERPARLVLLLEQGPDLGGPAERLGEPGEAEVVHREHPAGENLVEKRPGLVEAIESVVDHRGAAKRRLKRLDVSGLAGERDGGARFGEPTFLISARESHPGSHAADVRFQVVR